MRVVICETAEEVAAFSANEVVCRLGLSKSVRSRYGDVVLGLATGGTPLGLYRELVRQYRDGEITFEGVSTFNLDEYVGVKPEHKASYHYYMREHLFSHIDIDLVRTHLPQTDVEDLEGSAESYDAKIDLAEGIDLQILGIGVDGHIGFNEPGSSLASRTRVKTLAEQTRRDNARYFESLEAVPKLAVTMGIGTIREASQILLLATGESKAKAIRDTVEGPVTAFVPASALQLHPDVTVVIDGPASSILKHRDYYLESERNRTA